MYSSSILFDSHILNIRWFIGVIGFYKFGLSSPLDGVSNAEAGWPICSLCFHM